MSSTRFHSKKPLSLKPRFIGYDQDCIDLVPSHPGNGEAASVDRHFTELPPLADAEATNKKVNGSRPMSGGVVAALYGLSPDPVKILLM